MTLDAYLIANVQNLSDNSSLAFYNTPVEDEVEEQKLRLLKDFIRYQERLKITGNQLLDKIKVLFLVPDLEVLQGELSSATFQEEAVETVSIEVTRVDEGIPTPSLFEEDLRDYTTFYISPLSSTPVEVEYTDEKVEFPIPTDTYEDL
jgi:hypothetical protein